MAKKSKKDKMVFFGLDLAWSARNRSGCAVIKDGRLLDHTGALSSNEEILDFVRGHLPRGSGAIIGIDAPLRVPNESGWRKADRALSKAFRSFHAAAYPANRQRLAVDGVVRGEQLVEQFGARMRFSESVPIPKRSMARIVCEVYPHPAHVSLFCLEHTLKYKARSTRSYESRWQEFERYADYLRTLRKQEPALKGTKQLLKKTDVRALRGKGLKEYEDTLDAITCAYIVYYLWWHGPRRGHVYGSVNDGHILVPMTKEMKKRLPA